jgi:hypothetical protein
VKISELIAQLRVCLEAGGDVPVYFLGPCTYELASARLGERGVERERVCYIDEG